MSLLGLSSAGVLGSSKTEPEPYPVYVEGVILADITEENIITGLDSEELIIEIEELII